MSDAKTFDYVIVGAGSAGCTLTHRLSEDPDVRVLVLEAGGWDTLPATLIAGGLAWTFFAFVEIKDGFYYQLSPGDTVFNTIGAGLGVLMENVPVLDRLLERGFRVLQPQP